MFKLDSKALVAMLACLLSGLFFQSCTGNDDDVDGTNKETSVKEDSTNITGGFDGIVQCIGQLKSGDFAMAVKDFIGLSMGDVNNEQFVADIFERMDETVDLDHIDENSRFVLTHHAGTYTYDESAKTWSKVAGGNSAIFKFPSAPGKANNATLTINSYADKSANFDGDMVYLPSTFKVTLSVDGKEIGSINLKEVNYEASGEITIPTKIDAEIFLSPNTYQLLLEKKSSTEYTGSLTQVGNGCDLEISTTVTLAHGDLENTDLDDDLKMIEAKFKHNSLEISGQAEISKLLSLDNPTENQINSLIDFDVFYDGQKVGDLNFDKDTEEMLIVYKDGTSAKVSDAYLIAFLEELEIELVDWTGDWGVDNWEEEIEFRVANEK